MHAKQMRSRLKEFGYEIDYYDDTLELYLVAMLIYLELNDYDRFIKIYFPKLSKQDFYHLQARIFYDIKKHTPEKFKIIADAYKTLTLKQKSAVKAYLLDNREKLSMEKIAKKMKISRESLGDRIKGAIKKMKKYYEKNLPDWESTLCNPLEKLEI